MGSRIREIVHLLRTKGFRYTYNRVHFYIFWCWIENHPRLIRMLNWYAPYPSYIEIEVTTRCNLRCIMCEHTYWKEPARDMSFEEFKGIVDQFPNLKWIGLTGIGESFLNDDFMKMLSYVKRKQVFVELYDTFFFINEELANELIELKVDKILASIDGATKETYEKIRVGSDFERVIKNAENLLRLKKEKKASFPKIGFHFIINKYNFHEILPYIDLIKSISQGEDVTIQFTRMLHEFKDTKDLFVEIPDDTVLAVEQKAKDLGIEVVWNANVPQAKPPISNCIEYTMPFIFSSGDVIPCCSGNEAGNRNFQKATALGNIFEQSFKEIWRGEKYSLLRKAIREGKVPAPCNNCCLFSTKDGKSCES